MVMSVVLLLQYPSFPDVGVKLRKRMISSSRLYFTGTVGLWLAVVFCLMGAADVAATENKASLDLGNLLSSYGMPSGIVGLLGWFLRNLTNNIDKRMDDLLATLKEISKDHHESLARLVERNAELEKRVFDSLVAKLDAADEKRP